MRNLKVAVAAAAVILFSSSGIAAAAPKNYCADLKGVQMGSACQIQESDAGYNLDISFPTDYPDQKSLADYITQTRDAFLAVAKSPAPRELPYALDITSTNYGSAIPPRGTQAAVLKVYQNVGAAHPQTSFKAFNWDQTYRKPITYDTLWRVDDPLKTVFPIVQSDVQKQTGQQVSIAPTAGYDPMNYQEFAVTNDGVIFFFSQGQLLPEAAGAMQVLVPRSAIDPMLA
ncbi:esterase [Mycobacterium sp. MMS18-G62]